MAVFNRIAHCYPQLFNAPNPQGRVDISDLLGVGTYGRVYKGVMRETNEIVAVKIVEMKDQDMKDILLELEILRTCEHVNVTRFLGFFVDKIDLWICMEFCGAGTVFDLSRALNHPFNEEQIASIMYETVMGLEYLHTRTAVIHRDIKAANLLVTDEGDLKIADFGVSARLRSPFSRTTTFIGTPYYMAPEVILCDPDTDTSQTASYDSKSDIWSLGITCIELAEMSPPFIDLHPIRALRMILQTPDISLRYPEVWSDDFIGFIQICLDREPARRPTCQQLLSHPFLIKASGIDRKDVLKRVIGVARSGKEKEMTDGSDEEEIDRTFEIGEEEEAALEALEEEFGGFSDARQEEAMESLVQSTDNLSFPVMPNIPEPHTHSSNQLDSSSPPPPPPYFETPLMDFGPSAIFTQDALPSMSTIPIVTSAILEDRFVLIGNHHGLYSIDLTDPTASPTCVIKGVRFKQVEVVAENNVMLALSGRWGQMRQYNLDSIRRIVRGAEDPETISRLSMDFIKLISTKDTRSFTVQRTSTSCYLAIQFRRRVDLFQWAREPYLKFMKLKDFWIPSSANFITLVHDGVAVTDIVAGYATAANVINCSDPKLSADVKLSNMFNVVKGGKWQAFTQIPFTEPTNRAIRELSRSNISLSRKLTAVREPTTQGLTRKPQERFFLATFHRKTYVVDISGTPILGSGVGGWSNGVEWSEPPETMVLEPGKFVLGIGKGCLEVVDWKTGSVVQTLRGNEGDVVKVLGKGGGMVILTIQSKKRESMVCVLREVAGRRNASLENMSVPVSDSAGSPCDAGHISMLGVAPPNVELQPLVTHEETSHATKLNPALLNGTVSFSSSSQNAFTTLNSSPPKPTTPTTPTRKVHVQYFGSPVSSSASNRSIMDSPSTARIYNALIKAQEAEGRTDVNTKKREISPPPIIDSPPSSPCESIIDEKEGSETSQKSPSPEPPVRTVSIGVLKTQMKGAGASLEATNHMLKSPTNEHEVNLPSSLGEPAAKTPKFF
ncbi:Serine/threonine-protein kinase 4 [Dinochytrium kinnereticum]|nr:Serine/threonine-protein kinase 4 [Dinochytrium kinnereticum]